MTQIKSEKALNYLESNEYTVSHKYGDEVPCIDPNDAKQAIIIAETEAEERHAAQLELAVDRANVTMGAMILDGYEPEDACIKYMQELIEELQNLNQYGSKHPPRLDGRRTNHRIVTKCQSPETNPRRSIF